MATAIEEALDVLAWPPSKATALQTIREAIDDCEDSLARQEQYMRDAFAQIAENVQEAKNEIKSIALWKPYADGINVYLDAVLAIVVTTQDDGPTAEDLS